MSPSKFSANVLVSLATAPVLVALLGAKALAELLQTLGEASEEVFRGDRLPLLKLPQPTPTSEIEPEP